MKTYHCELDSEQDTVVFGQQLSASVNETNTPLVAYLYGDLGAGKTTLSRGFITGMGHQGNVKSPTYTLVEPYELTDWHVYHFDLYRLADPEELEFMGIRDYFNHRSCALIEWPDKGANLIAPADLVIELRYADQHRTINLQAKTENGVKILEKLVTLR